MKRAFPPNSDDGIHILKTNNNQIEGLDTVRLQYCRKQKEVL